MNSFNLSIKEEIEIKYGAYNLTYSPNGKNAIVAGTISVDGRLYSGSITILDSSDFSIVKEIVRIDCDVKGIKIDGVKGLDPVLEDALRRAM